MQKFERDTLATILQRYDEFMASENTLRFKTFKVLKEETEDQGEILAEIESHIYEIMWDLEVLKEEYGYIKTPDIKEMYKAAEVFLKNIDPVYAMITVASYLVEETENTRTFRLGFGFCSPKDYKDGNYAKAEGKFRAIVRLFAKPSTDGRTPYVDVVTVKGYSVIAAIKDAIFDYADEKGIMWLYDVDLDQLI